MEPTTTFFSFVVLKKLADSLGLTDALKDKRKKIAIKVIDHTVPDSIKKALDNFLNSSDVSPLFEKAFASLEMENKQIKRQFVLKMLTDPAISQAIADCEKGQPPQADILTPLFTELLPGRDAQATAEEVVQVFYREFAKNENLIHRLDVTHYFLSTEMDKTTRRIENKIDQLKPAAPVPLYNLPPVQPRFVGREDDLQKLHDFLVTQQGVAQIVGGRTAGVHGMGGLGKSYLAIQFAHQCVQQSEFPGGILFQACSGNSLETIVSEMCEAASVEVHNLPFEKAVQRLKNALASRRLLLILDDVQHDHIETLLPGGQVSVLITSRRRDLPFLVENEVLDLQLFSQTECTDLFRKILGDEVDRHPEEARALFTALGHLPVAIAVAASLLKDSVKWTFASLRAFLSENSGLAELHNSKVNVDKLLTEAITSLPQENQKLLCAMTACAAEGFFFSLACRVAGREAKDLLPGLQLLFNSNLVRELDREQQRYFVHALIRQAAARLPFFAALPEKHARLLRDDFKLWENNWQVLQDFLPEARQATEWVLHSNNSETGYWLLYYAYSLCSRIGRLQEALEFMQEYEKLALQLDDKDSLQISYGNQALILQAWGKLEEALALHKKQEAICLELGNKGSLQASYGNQGLILQDWGKLEEALALHKKKEAICLELGNKDSLQISYGNQGLILKAWGKLEEALALHKKKEAICLELGNKDSLQISYGNQGLILKAWGKLEEALALHKKQEAICLELGNKDSLQRSYGNQGVILEAWGKLEEALALHKKKEAICLELGNKDGLQASYGNQALILQDWGKLEEALALHKKQEAICLELGNKDGLQASYGNQALILQDWGKLEEALALHKKKEEICLELGNKDSLQRSYGNQALILKAWGKLEEALALHKKQEEICLELGNKDSLQRSYGNQASILQVWGKLEEALALHKKKEAICLELGNQSGLAYCYWSLSLLFEEQKKKVKALDYAQQSLAIFTRLKMPREREAVEKIVEWLK